jgi:DNA polymerase-4
VGERAGPRTIVHVDMDAFYASVEQRDDPALRGRPVVVGGPSQRGVVTAASYEARRFGVKSAMSMVEALRRCPDAVVRAGRHERYAEVSEQVFAILGAYSPLVEPLSIDEAFVDVTESRALFGDGEAIARAIRARVRDELGLTASAGVGPSKFVAKIASDLRKPDALVVVRADEVEAFLAPLPVERMWGVGPKAAASLRGLGLRTLGALARAGPEALERHLGAWGRSVHALARGHDERPVVPEREASSIGAEETFGHDLSSREALEERLLGQAARVARRLVARGLFAHVVTVKVKYADFTLVTRRARRDEAVCDARSLHETAKALLARAWHEGRPVRLTGVSASELVHGPTPTLFPDAEVAKRAKLEALVSQVSERFGEAGLSRATLARRPR